jgi:hypothetical protein
VPLGLSPDSASLKCSQPSPAQFAQQLDVLPGDVELKRAQAVTGAGGMSVVVLVPALPQAQDGHPPALSREIGAIEVAVAKGVPGGVHQPAGVIDEHQAQGDAPQHQGSAAGTRGGADPEQQTG